MAISVPQGRKKPVEMTMHAVRATSQQAPIKATRVEVSREEKLARDGAAILGWLPEEIDAALKVEGSWVALNAKLSAEIARLDEEGH